MIRALFSIVCSIMKKLKNKFILGVIFIIAFIICFQVFVAYSNDKNDTNSYLILIKWNATLNEIRLLADTKSVLNSWDKVRVIWESSLAVIEWWDGSLTRLWWNTKISIQQNQISRDYTNINISFELIAGKTWSNVVSFIGKDSSFTQTFDGIEAWVRGTIFDVDLEKDFIHVSDHAVDLKDNAWNTVRLNEWEILSLDKFSLIEVSEFINSLQDEAWKSLNQQFDREYLDSLNKKVQTSLQENNPFVFILSWVSPKYGLLYTLDTATSYESVEKYINKLSDKSKSDIYTYILSKYQWLNSISPENQEMYMRKLFYKKALVSLTSQNDEAQRLLESSAYDAQDILESGSTQWLRETLGFLNENTRKLSGVDISFLKGWFEYIPEDLRDEFWKSFQNIEKILDIDFNSIDKNSLWEVLDGADNAIQNFLEEKAGGLLKQVIQ